jgi:hypothetical protein
LYIYSKVKIAHFRGTSQDFEDVSANVSAERYVVPLDSFDCYIVQLLERSKKLVEAECVGEVGGCS